MITKNADGTYTVAGVLTCLSEEAALAMLEDTGVFALVDPLTIEAAKPPVHQYSTRTVADPVSRMPKVEVFMIEAA